MPDFPFLQLRSDQPIVDPETGLPTEYFLEMMFGATDNSEQTAEDVTGKVDKTTQVIAGNALAGGGALDQDVTIDLDAVIDDLNDVDTTSTAPTNGQALLWNSGSSLWLPGSISSNASYCRIYRNAAVNTSGAGFWTVPYDTVSVDPDTIADLANNGIKPTTAGYYLVSGRLRTNVAGQTGFFLRRDATLLMGVGPDIGGQTAVGGTSVVYLDGTQTIKGDIFSSSAQAVTLGNFDTWLELTGPLVT